MLKESGRVVAIEKDCLWVETIRQSTCNSCSAQKGCGHSLLNKAGAGHRHHLRVLLRDHSVEDFSIDDEVDISIPEQVLVTGALLVYLLPLITMLVSALLTSYWWVGDIPALVGAIVGFVIGLGVVKLHSVINLNNTEIQPILIARSGGDGTASVQLMEPV